MIAAVFVIVVVLWLAGGVHSHVHHRRRGRRVNIGWSLSRGLYGSARIFGGTYRRRL